MPVFSPNDLTAWSGGRWTQVPRSPVTGFQIDSRALGKGDCFVAIRTERRDGHDFLQSAVEQGASAALVERPVAGVALPQLVVENTVKAFQAIARAHRLDFSGVVIGVTGSAGKTSTKEMLRSVLGAERVHATAKNLNNTLGVPLTLLGLDSARHRFAVIEAGINQPREMAILADMIQPDVGVVTNVGAAHLELLGDLAGVAREKGKLLEATRTGGAVVFPSDCDEYASFRDLGSRRLVVGEARTGANTIFQAKLQDQVFSPGFAGTGSHPAGSDPSSGIELRLDLPGRAGFTLKIPEMSGGMVQNAALVATVAAFLGIERDAIQAGLSNWKPSAQRGEIRTVGDQVYYVDCYNANPLSMADALRHFDRRFPASLGRRLFVLGSMRELGAGAVAAHRAVGAQIPAMDGDQIILIGEGASAMAGGALDTGISADVVRTFPRADAARDLVEAFEGAIFLKGSRAFGLETLLPKREGAAC